MQVRTPAELAAITSGDVIFEAEVDGEIHSNTSGTLTLNGKVKKNSIIHAKGPVFVMEEYGKNVTIHTSDVVTIHTLRGKQPNCPEARSVNIIYIGGHFNSAQVFTGPMVQGGQQYNITTVQPPRTTRKRSPWWCFGLFECCDDSSSYRSVPAFTFGGLSVFNMDAAEIKQLTLSDSASSNKDSFKIGARTKIGIVYDANGKDITAELAQRMQDLDPSEPGLRIGSHFFARGVIFGTEQKKSAFRT